MKYEPVYKLFRSPDPSVFLCRYDYAIELTENLKQQGVTPTMSDYDKIRSEDLEYNNQQMLDALDALAGMVVLVGN